MNGALVIGSGGTGQSKEGIKQSCLNGLQEFNTRICQTLILYGASITDHYAFQIFSETNPPLKSPSLK